MEILRIVREVDAPRPSTKLSSSAALPSIAANRGTEPAKLTRLMRGELDWVLLKALEKDRARRYETANGFARDIQRYLADEVVEARPPSTAYRLRKFVRRHKAQATAVSLILLALLAGIAGTSYGLYRADQQWQAAELARYNEQQRADGEGRAKLDAEAKRAEAEKQQHRAEAGEKLADERRRQVEAEKKKVEEEKQIAQAVQNFLQFKLLGQADTTVQADALLRAGESSGQAKLNPTIRELLDRAALELAPDRIEANFPRQPLVQADLLETVGNTYCGLGEYGRAIEFLSRAVNLLRIRLGADHANTLAALDDLAWAVKEAGQSRNAIELFERAHDAQVSKYGTDDPRTLRTLANLALSYRDAGQSLKATKLLEEVCNTRVKKFEADDPATLIALANLAESYREAGKLPQAIELFERVRDRMVKSLGADHPGTLTLLHNLAGAYLSAGKSPQAIALYERVRDAEVKKLGADHPDTLRTFLTLSAAYFSAGELSRAFALMERGAVA